MNAAVYDLKYLSSGAIVRVLGKTSSGQFVCEVGRQHEDEDENDDGQVWFDGTVRVVSIVYDEAPVEAFEKRCVALASKETELRARISQLTAELSKAEQEGKARAARLSDYNKLQYVEDFIIGKITHYVVENYDGVAILPVEKALDASDREYDRKPRLLILMGDPKRDVNWVLSRWSDGSGSHDIVHPCTSLEMAQEIAKQVTARMIVEYESKGQLHNIPRLLPHVKELGVEVSAELLQRIRSMEIDSAKTAFAKADAELEKCRAGLAELSR